MKILIAGANGYLGRKLSEYFLKHSDFKLILFARSIPKMTDQVQSSQKFIWIQHLPDSFADDSNLKDVDLILNTVGKYLKTNELDQRSSLVAANTNFPLELLKRSGPNQTPLIHFNTALPPDLDLYAQTKHQASLLMQEHFADRIIIDLKTHQFYGPQDGRFIQMLVDHFKYSKPSIELTSGHQIRDFIYIEDVLAAIHHIIQSRPLFEKGYHSVELGSTKGYSIRQVFKTLESVLPGPHPKALWGKRANRPNEPEKLVAANKFLKSIGWSPYYNLRSGLEHLLKTN
jgi:nucleoside-diphosphate-sugar epimerase